MNGGPVTAATHKANSIGRRVRVDILGQLSAMDPLRNRPQWNDVYAQEQDNIWMSQTFPYYDLLEEGLSFRQTQE